jgi:YrbI family 3-deoxy-D-manno-octulosonate 8-phosphate phosphatase
MPGMDAPHLTALHKIRLLVLDVDGVLTDGGLYYGEDGLHAKRFHARDGLGLKILAHNGIQLALLSGDPSAITMRRAERLQIAHLLLGVNDKLEALHALLDTLELPLAQTAYMGDDLNDVQCLQAVGFGAVPVNAVSEACGAADYICVLPGGAGCVREVCDLIREAQELPLPAHFALAGDGATSGAEIDASP